MKKNYLRNKMLGMTALMASAFVATGCGSGAAPAPAGNTAPGPVEIEASYSEDYVEGQELLCLCDSQEEAESIAEMYGIELVEFSYGVATFHAEKPREVIAMGKEKGYPLLEINGMMQTY